MADKRAYFKLDVGYLTNPKVAMVAAESASAVLLHVGSIGYAAQHLTDGVVPVALLLRLTGATKKDAALLFDSELWVDLDNGKAEVHDFLEHQRSSDEVKGAKEKAKRAASARWNAESNASGTAPSNASSIPDASETAMPREIGEREEREKDIGASAPANKAAKKRAMPASWRPNEFHEKYAKTNGLDLAHEVAQFKDDRASKNVTYADWDAGFRTWLRNSAKWSKERNPAQPVRHLPHAADLEQPPDGLDDAEYAEWQADPKAEKWRRRA